MSSKWRRFEVLLPLQFNDGRDVAAETLVNKTGFEADVFLGQGGYFEVGVKERDFVNPSHHNLQRTFLVDILHLRE